MNDKIPPGYDFNLHQAADKTGYCVQHLRRLCHRGAVPCGQRGHNFFFTENDITEMVKRRGPGADAPMPDLKPKTGLCRGIESAPPAGAQELPPPAPMAPDDAPPAPPAEHIKNELPDLGL